MAEIPVDPKSDPAATRAKAATPPDATTPDAALNADTLDAVTNQEAEREAVRGESLMDNPEVEADRDHTAIDYAHAAGEVIEPVEAGPGDMPVERQNLTFEGFMSITRYGGTAVVLLVFWATLVYAMGAVPIWAALSTFGLGLALAAALKLRGAYFFMLIIATIAFWVISIFTQTSPEITDPEDVAVDAATDES